MTRLITILSVGLLPIASIAVAQTHKAPTTKACARQDTTLIDGEKPKAGVHKLGDEPPAKQYLAVLRAIDGCPAPVVLRQRIGARR